MPDVNVNVAANISKAKKDLLGLEKDIKRMQTTASKGININGKGGVAGGSSAAAGNKAFNSSALGGAGAQGFKMELGNFTKEIGGQFSMLSSAIGGLSKIMSNPYAMAAAGAITIAKGSYDHFKQKATEQAAMARQEREYGRVFSSIRGNDTAVDGVAPAVKKMLQNLRLLSSLSGKPFEQLAQSAGRLMVAFEGSTNKAWDFTKAITVWSMATGRSTDELADLIVKIEQMDRVEAGAIKQMAEMGIPIYEKLADILGVSVEKAKELANNGAIFSGDMLKAFKATADIHKSLIDLNKAISEPDLDKLGIKELETRIAYLERILYGKSGDAQEALVKREKKDRAQDLEDIKDSPSARMLLEAGGGVDLIDSALYEVKRFGYKGVEGLLKGGAWLGYHAKGLTTNEMEQYAKDALKHAKGENDKYRSWFYKWGAEGKSVAEGLVTDGYWIDPKTGKEMGNISIEDAAKTGKDTKDHAFADAIAAYEDIMFEIEKVLQWDYVEPKDRAALEEELQFVKDIIEELKEAKKMRAQLFDAEVAELKKKETADKLQEKQWAADGDYFKIWNKKHSGDDNKFLDRVEDVDQVLERYEEGVQLIRDGNGDEIIAAYVDFWGKFWTKTTEDRKKAEEEAAKKAKEEKEKAEKLSRDRKMFFLSHRAETDAGAKFQKDLMNAQERMRELGITEVTMKRIGEEMKHNAGEEYRKKIKETDKRMDDVAGNLRKTGVIPTRNKQGYQQWVWDEMESRPQNVMKTSYERGAWGQALKLQEYDETALQIQEQRKDLLEQLKVMQEQKAIAEKQLAAIERINTTPKAQ